MSHECHSGADTEQAETTKDEANMQNPIQDGSRQSALAEAQEAADGTGAYLRALSEKFRSHIPEEERRRIPPDFSKNHRHYRNTGRKEIE